MERKSNLSLVGFLAALTALEVAAPAARTLAAQPKHLTVEARLTRLSDTLKNRVDNLSETNPSKPEIGEIVGSFVNRGGGGGFVNRGGGGFVNRRPWRNGWGDGGGFLNRRY
ncbi:MAG: GrrA/OscA1 family cyclophane-containing rSAM-modified RiPP [Spirulina sp.]